MESEESFCVPSEVCEWSFSLPTFAPLQESELAPVCVTVGGLNFYLAFSHTSEYKWYAPSERFQGFDLAV